MGSSVHDWLRKIRVGYVPRVTTPLLEGAARGVLEQFVKKGHVVLSAPHGEVDVLLTTAVYGETINWRDALFFNAKRSLGLQTQPTVFTLLHIRPSQLNDLLAHLGRVLNKETADPADYPFAGLSPRAFTTLHEQGRRGGPLLAALRLFQCQTMCVRLMVLVGEDYPLEAYTCDLVGAHPRTVAGQLEAFYEDLMLRIVTAVSTREITAHERVTPDIPQVVWKALSTPAAMQVAGLEFGKRQFFTDMVVVSNLVAVPMLNHAISRQYSEGCFATWEPRLEALITTITGSARPVNKGRLTEDELAVITGVRPDGLGARVRHVEGKRNDPPSSEAVELVEMDAPLPRITLSWGAGAGALVPVARSKLHGHRGVRSFDPQRVEHVYLPAPYYRYPVSCSTEAQARAICEAFSHSQALQNPGDPRQIVFTILPGHGVVIVEKWVEGKAPFQVIWEAMDDGSLMIDSRVPQGRLSYRLDGAGRMILEEE
ncbi:MAG TPA: hypothetical protein DEQ80_02390 [Anaerolinea thermolimosa]|uniref:Uncharacterized protein n=1 Tax=Anaerolinea thermolimosa TaxID=229919 RepID=A0A3D1JEL6_9CHLR|nr:hypothetical protein [Anaerolinea thermolimosa]GAP07584.1 hypothetical protein ATHL_02470 [Anaerolinea thermolimosa]HCE16687.1 hypothetical protein [Anaerolinea thermolimosa]